MKTCIKCLKDKELTEFHNSKKSKDGHNSVCRICKCAYDRKMLEDPDKKRKKLAGNEQRKVQLKVKLYDYMRDKGCTLCDETDISCLQFDHRDPSQKLFNIADGATTGKSWETIMVEIAKCDILCANCHHKKTAIQQGWYSYISDRN